MKSHGLIFLTDKNNIMKILQSKTIQFVVNMVTVQVFLLTGKTLQSVKTYATNLKGMQISRMNNYKFAISRYA